eukprot:CAMPEP_0119376636 /NCGR_PEP_ID=MMETSP1334-20130426/40417_1 /TAXON_ID=127549 /ORGANISM="Calcidiscus leptoporus, Strain RCC1130" /LENGTH=108 /DNA_ID=CAMNT_0007395247 /DNA_START=31 /DNA_END=360 /DNA_ORIENTATION=-
MEEKKLQKKIKKTHDGTKQLKQEVQQFKSKVHNMEAKAQAQAEEAKNAFIQTAAALRRQAENARDLLPSHTEAVHAKEEELSMLTKRYASLREQIRELKQQRTAENVS